MRDAMSRELKIVTVTRKPDLCPEYAEASAEYPKLVKYVEDDSAVFVVDPETGNFWPAAEFFHMCAVTTFFVNPAELPLPKTCPDGRPLTSESPLPKTCPDGRPLT